MILEHGSWQPAEEKVAACNSSYAICQRGSQAMILEPRSRATISGEFAACNHRIPVRVAPRGSIPRVSQSPCAAMSRTRYDGYRYRATPTFRPHRRIAYPRRPPPRGCMSSRFRYRQAPMSRHPHISVPTAESPVQSGACKPELHLTKPRI